MGTPQAHNPRPHTPATRPRLTRLRPHDFATRTLGATQYTYVQSINPRPRCVVCPRRVAFNITTVFSHSQTVVLCGSCSAVLCQPTGGKARLTEGCSFRPKVQ